MIWILNWPLKCDSSDVIYFFHLLLCLYLLFFFNSKVLLSVGSQIPTVLGNKSVTALIRNMWSL